MILRSAFLLFSFLLTLTSFSQRVQDWIILGDRAMEDQDPVGALSYYQNAMDMDSSKSEIQYKYAGALRKNNYYKKATHYYFQIYRKEQAHIYPLSGFWLAMMQKQSGKYQEAKQTFRRVRDQFEEQPDSYYYEKAVQEMRSCDFAELWVDEESGSNQIKPVGGIVNSESSEFDGKFYGDGRLMFTSLRGDYDQKGRLLSEQYEPQIYLSDKSFSELLEFPDDLKGALGFAASVDSSYTAVVEEDESGNTILLKENSKTIARIPTEKGDSAWYSHPAFGQIKGQQVLFFSSNRPGGEGREDIWYIHLDNPSEYHNAGNMVNSPGSEITPFYRADEELLYLASDWHYGMGGYDIFSVQLSGDGFGIPNNLKPPFNTSSNDLYYSFSGKASKGSLTSNRTAVGEEDGMGCCNDIYYFEAEIVESEKPLISSLEDLNKYLPVTLYFHNDEPDPKTRDTTTAQNYIDTYYKYINRITEYEREYSMGLSDKKSDNAEEQIDQFFLEKVDQGVSDLEFFTSLLEEELKKGSRVELTVRGFASPLAETDYNVNLTSRRISSLVNYLREFRGGELIPYLENQSEDGGYLTLIKIPFGEYIASEVVSDNPNESNAIYSIGAAQERKIEIVSVQQSTRDSNHVELNFQTEIANLGTVSQLDTLSYQFNFTMNENCIIDTVYSESASISISEFYLDKDDGFIRIQIVPGGLAGKQRHRIFIEGNFPEKKKELNITFEVNE